MLSSLVFEDMFNIPLFLIKNSINAITYVAE